MPTPTPPSPAAPAAEQGGLARPAGPPGGVVSTTDLLKAAGLVFVLADHWGLFFDEDRIGWRIAGRLAAPIFFFLIGYARSRSVPLSWLVLGAALTVLDAVTSDEAWDEAELNILLSFAVLRLLLPRIEVAIMPRPLALGLLVVLTIALIPSLGSRLEYGMEGVLWAYFGLAARLAQADETAPSRLRAVALGGIAALAYVIVESRDHELTMVQTAILAVLVAGLLGTLLRFRRTPSRWQPGHAAAAALRLVGRHSLSIYAVSLGGMQTLAFLLDDAQA